MKNLVKTLVVVLVAASATSCWAQRGPGGGRGFRGGAGDPDFVADRDTFHELLGNGKLVKREVHLTAQGVETLTESSDPRIAGLIKEHVHAMHRRIKENRPVRQRDPLFAEVFRQADKIQMEIDETEHGVRVRESSTDPQVVKLLQAHAQVVTGFVEHGFAEARRDHAVPTTAAAAAPSDRGDSALAAVQQAFAEFDRAYIPALALTDRGDGPGAAKALDWLMLVAAGLRETPLAELSGPADAEDWVAQVNALCEAANSQLQAGKGKAAHETLEPIRGLLAEVRAAAVIPYALDVLAAYHETMEQIVKPAAQAAATGRELTARELERCRSLAVEAATSWARIEQTELMQPYFEFTAEQKLQIKQGLVAERNAIGELNQALRTQDGVLIRNAARGLKPPFARVYTAFGEFPEGVPASGPPRSP